VARRQQELFEVREKLTAALVRRYTEQEPPARETVIWDAALPRFALRVRPPRASGAPCPSVYLVQWRGADGRGGKQVVGTPATHTLDQAREAAKAVLRRVDAGANPNSEKAAQRAVWTFREAADAYVASAEFAKKTAKVRAGDRATLTNHIVPRLGREKLPAIDVPLVRRLLRGIEGDQRTNRRKRRLGGPGAARKAVRLLSAMLTWAVHEGRLATNPIIGNLRLTGDGTRETVLERPEQYAALLGAMDLLVAEGALRAPSRAFIILAAATGLRRGEIQALRWGQIDLAARRITLTSSKGAKLAKGGPRTEKVSLPPVAAAALAAICPAGIPAAQQVFMPRRGRAYEINRDWLTVRAAAGLPADLTLHGLRHSIGTQGVLAGLSVAEVQKLLRHRNITTAAKYIHLAEGAMGRLQDRAIDHLMPAGNAPASVLPLRRGHDR
jgi:integrase